jgi:lipoate-protein ligase B
VSAPAWAWRGRLPYGRALEEQRRHREALRRGEAAEAIWLLEHPPVVTTGRRRPADLPSAETLAAEGVELHATERGGLSTWHGPGQLVAYLLIDAGGRGLGPRSLVPLIEEAVIDWLADIGVEAGRRAPHPGVWVGREKLCAIGLHYSRGYTLHGLALNLDPDLRGFALIVPCGIQDGAVGSVAGVLGAAPAPEEAAGTLGPLLSGRIGAHPRRTEVAGRGVDAPPGSQ